MSDVKRVTLTTIGDVVKKGGGGGGGIGASGGASPFSALAFDSANVMHSGFGGSNSSSFGAGSRSPAGKESGGTEAGAEGKPSSSKKRKTARLELNLFEPTADSFPEFNFSKLVHEEQKRLKKAQQKRQQEEADANNGFLSDPELDNDVARVARELERKYGSGTAYASKDKFARPSKLDYYDRGAGYDEEDSFIDNSEAYDELIPQEIETADGGFYINSGQLEFKQLSNFERPDDVHRMPKPKKRALSTTSESSDDEQQQQLQQQRSSAPAKKKPEQPSSTSPPPEKSSSPATAEQQQKQTEEEKANSAGNNSGTDTATGDEKPRLNGHVAKKQKTLHNGVLAKGGGSDKEKGKSNADGSVAKEKTNGVKAKGGGTPAEGAVMAAGTTPGLGGKDENENDGDVKAIKTTTVKDMLRAKRDSLRKMEQEKKGRSSGSSRVSSSEAEEDGDAGGDEEEEDEENDEEEDDDNDEEEGNYETGEEGENKSEESSSEEEIVSDSEASQGSASEKEATVAASSVRAKVITNGTDSDGQRSAVAIVPEQQSQQQQPLQPQQQPPAPPPKERKLPDDLPEALRKDIEALKELARSSSGTGEKLNYFDNKVADVLVQIDEGARAVGNSTRNAIFRHLEVQLSISRQSLQLKLKKIRIRKLDGRAKMALDQLEDAVSDQMPLLLAKHELECRKVSEMRAAQAQAVAAVASPSATGAPMANGGKPETTAPPAPAPQIRNPKKRYSWSKQTRDLLWELYGIRVQTFVLLRPRNETEDEFVAEYLRNKVVPLWPKGWMRYEDLHKELDRRKKAIAKSAGTAAVVAAGPVPAGKKQPVGMLPALASPPPSAAFDSASWMAAGGVPASASVTMNGSVKASVGGGTASAAFAVAGKVPGGSPKSSDRAGGCQPSPTGPGMDCLSPSKRTSDHSISNIMNSPPLPPPSAAAAAAAAGARSSFEDDLLMLSPPKPATGGGGGSDLNHQSKRDPKTTPGLPVPVVAAAVAANRQRWNSREEDSDSSIEIVGEYSVTSSVGAGDASLTAAAGAGAGAGSVMHSTKSFNQSALASSSPSTSASAQLPVLNKEKYKNLSSSKTKSHSSTTGSSGGGGEGSPVQSSETVPGGGKYSTKQPPSAGGSSSNVLLPGSPAAVVAQGVPASFAVPAGSSSTPFGTPSGAIRMGGGGGGRSAKHSSSSTGLDLEMHQIIKDITEYQELQQQHHSAASGHNKQSSDVPTIATQLQQQQQQQQQHDTLADLLLGCDLDEDDLLFATNNYSYGGGKN